MRYESLSDMMRKRAEAKASGSKKRAPLHTLKECCEEAGISPQWFGRWAAQFPGAPKPVQGVFHNHRMPYYHKREVVQWINQIKEKLANQKGTVIMPSIQDALKQALERAVTPTPAPMGQPAIPSDWDDEGGVKEIKETITATNKENNVPTTQPTNISKETFEYILENPRSTRIQIMRALTERGYSAKTISSLLAQMREQGMVDGDAKEGLFAIVDEYRPIKQNKYVKRTKRKYVRVKPLANRKVSEAPALKEKKEAVPPEQFVFKLLESLTVLQARAVYDELKKIFGETK